MNSKVEFFKTEIPSLKIMLLCMIPLSLLFSIKWNSYIILINFIVFLPVIIKNLKSINHKKFWIYLALSFCYFLAVLFGALIDSFYGIFDVKFMERLIPFILFPLIFCFGTSKNEDSFKIIKVFSIVITFVNVILILISLFNFSEPQFYNQNWIKSNVNVINTKVKSPDQLKGAVFIKENNEFGLHDLTLNVLEDIQPTTEYVRSIYLKSNGRNWVLIRHFDGVQHNGVWFNIEQGVIGHEQNGVEGKIEKINNGWFKCSVINKTRVGTSRERLQVTITNRNKGYKYKGNNIDGVYAWGAQIQEGRVSSIFTPDKIKKNYQLFYREFLLAPLNIHPTYYSIFVIVAILFFITKVNSSNMIFFFTSLIINTSVVFLTASKASIFSLLVIFAIFIFYFLRKRRIVSVILLFIFIISLFVIEQSSYINKRINSSIKTAFTTDSINTSTDNRMVIWESIFQFSKKELLIGSGNVNSSRLLITRSGLDLNAHNQYFQTLISSGLLGLVLLLTYLTFLLFIVPKSSKIFIFVFSLVALFGISFVFESILYRQWGIVFMSFFYSLILSDYIKLKDGNLVE